MPVLCSCWCAGRFIPRTATGHALLLRFTIRRWTCALRHRHGLVLGRPRLVLLGRALVLPVPAGMGSEFMPPLNEGSLLFMPVLLPSTSLTEVKRIMAWQDQVIRTCRKLIRRRQTRPRRDATDPAPVEMIETTIMLKPESQWREGMTKESSSPN